MDILANHSAQICVEAHATTAGKRRAEARRLERIESLTKSQSEREAVALKVPRRWPRAGITTPPCVYFISGSLYNTYTVVRS